MQSYDPPPQEVDDLTPQEAQAALNAMHAGGQEHPLFDGNHPQHADFTAYSTKLYALIAQADAEEKDAAAVQALEDARAETGDLTPAECLARARELMMTPGYLNHTMPPEERAALAKEISTLYLVGCQQEPSTPEEMEMETDDEL
jgi:hypothetical protein